MLLEPFLSKTPLSSLWNCCSLLTPPVLCENRFPVVFVEEGISTIHRTFFLSFIRMTITERKLYHLP